MNNDFMNMLQAASNSVAGNVSGPVDILSWLLRKSGVPVPENALLSSKWMEEQGLMKPVRPGVGQLVGESVGLISPIVAAAKAPQIAAAALKGGENLAARQTLNPQTGAIVWHGSPHKFDKFDSSKIGTGEGAQAYGHGLYVADAPDVARTYATPEATYQRASGHMSPKEEFAFDLFSKGQSEDDVFSAMYRRYGKAQTDEEMDAIADAMKSAQAKATSGSLYKVDLPDDKIAKMLDWDKPLSEQAPEVRKAIAPAGASTDRCFFS